VPLGDHAKRRLVFLHLARVTTCQLYIAVQNVQDTLAYTIHEFFVTLRNDGFTQFRFGRFQHPQSVIICSHPLHRLNTNRRRGEVYFSGIIWYEISEPSSYFVSDLRGGSRGVFVSRPGKHYTDLYYIRGTFLWPGT